MLSGCLPEAVVGFSAKAVFKLSAYGCCPLKLFSGCLPTAVVRLSAKAVVWLPEQVDFLLQPKQSRQQDNLDN